MASRKKSASDPDAVFAKALTAAGAEILAPTNPYEVMRFRTCHGVGVIYQNARGKRSWNPEVQAAKDHLAAGKGSLAPVAVHGRRRDTATVRRVLARDGDRCFFCRTKLGADITIEHLVSIAHGGPNHIANLFLAHEACNRRAGHLSAPEKVAMRDAWKCEAAA